MVAHATAAVAGCIVERLAGKPFLIDPMTHVFQHALTHLLRDSNRPPTEINPLKRTWVKLAGAYGDVFSSALKSFHPIVPGDFAAEAVVDSVAERVAQFQGTTLQAAFDAGPDHDLLEFALVGPGGGDAGSAPMTPAAVVAPYFFVADTETAEWLDVNRRLAIAARSAVPGRPVFVEVVVEGRQTQQFYDQVARTYQGISTDGFLLWVDRFVEAEATEVDLESYVALLKQLGRIKPVTILHGGYLAIVLGRFPQLAVAGVCHGMEYGEDRGVVPAGGGLPMAKFYHPKLHRRLSLADCIPVVAPYLTSADHYRAFVCDCAECEKMLGSDPNPVRAFARHYGDARPVSFARRNQMVVLDYPTAETKAHCLSHYLESKRREYDEDDDLPTVVGRLRDTYEELGRQAGQMVVSHVGRWIRLLEKIRDKT